jgi:hypothetical protein
MKIVTIVFAVGLVALAGAFTSTTPFDGVLEETTVESAVPEPIWAVELPEVDLPPLPEVE